MGAIMSDISCPCNSGHQFNRCCAPYLQGKVLPETAESLMRSRYTAYVQQNAQYLVDTWQLATSTDQRLLLDSLENTFKTTTWLGLQIIKSENDPKNNKQAFVEFMAYFNENNHQQTLYERSRFQRINQHWFYVDGVHPKVERNTPCPCGSGKKYKKCCG